MQIPIAYKDYISFAGRYAFLIGGAGAGKSEAVARKTVLRALQGGRHLVIRKYATTLKQSVIHTILQVLNTENIQYTYMQSEKIIKLNNGEILFLGLDDPEKLKSIHGIVTAWIEEASEITREEFNQVDLRLRGNYNTYKQITCTLNPVMSARWVLDVINEKPASEVYEKVYTYKDNPFLDLEYKAMLENISDRRYKNVYVEGKWDTSSDALVFTNVISASEEDEKVMIEEDENENVIYGLDFGYNNPTSLVYVKKQENDTFFIKELLYKTHLTNNELINFLKQNVKQNAIIYCDSAEPARIEEIRRAGFNAKAANKDVQAGITFIKNYKIKASGSNLLKELSTYSYKTDRNNNVLEEVLKINDHAIDAMRYAIYTHFANANKRLTEKDVVLAWRLNEFV